MGLGGLVLGSLIFYFKDIRRTVFQLFGFYYQVLVCLDPTASKLGASLIDQLKNVCGDDVIVSSISDAFKEL